MTFVLRQAVREDIPGMHHVRLAVRENRLRSLAIGEEDYIREIEGTGRGWVIEVYGQVVAFAIGNVTTGNIWALFVDPEHEARGYGRLLHDEMVGWLFGRGLSRLDLGTAPGTRAQRFYEAAGWRYAGLNQNGEAMYELTSHNDKL